MPFQLPPPSRYVFRSSWPGSPHFFPSSIFPVAPSPSAHVVQFRHFPPSRFPLRRFTPLVILAPPPLSSTHLFLPFFFHPPLLLPGLRKQLNRYVTGIRRELFFGPIIKGDVEWNFKCRCSDTVAMWQLASFVTSGENGQHCVKVGHAVTPRFFPLDVCATAKKKGPTGLLSFSLSFIYCSILFPFVLVLLFSPRTSRREVAVRLDLILPFSKNNDFAEKIFATFIGLGLQVKQSVFREYSFTFVLEKIALCISSRFLSISVR